MTSTQPFDYSCDVGCEPRNVTELLKMVERLALFAPKANSHLPAEFVLRTFGNREQAETIKVDYVECLKAPIWAGLREQCRIAANADLLRARASQQIAERLAAQQDWKAAAGLYVDAIRGIVGWRKRKVYAGNVVVSDDSGLVLVSVEESLQTAPPEETVKRCRKEWQVLWNVETVIPPPDNHKEPRLAVFGGVGTEKGQ